MSAEAASVVGVADATDDRLELRQGQSMNDVTSKTEFARPATNAGICILLHIALRAFG